MKAHVGQAGDSQPGQEQAGTFQQGLKGAADRQPGRGCLYGIGTPPAVGGKRRVRETGKLAGPLEQGGRGPERRLRIGKNQREKLRPFQQGQGARRAVRTQGIFPAPDHPFTLPTQQLAGQHVAQLIQSGPLAVIQQINGAAGKAALAGQSAQAVGQARGRGPGGKSPLHGGGRQGHAIEAAGVAQPVRQRRTQTVLQQGRSGIIALGRGREKDAVHPSFPGGKAAEGSAQTFGVRPFGTGKRQRRETRARPGQGRAGVQQIQGRRQRAAQRRKTAQQLRQQIPVKHAERHHIAAPQRQSLAAGIQRQRGRAGLHGRWGIAPVRMRRAGREAAEGSQSAVPGIFRRGLMFRAGRGLPGFPFRVGLCAGLRAGQGAGQIPDGRHLQEVLKIDAQAQALFGLLEDQGKAARTQGQIVAQVHLGP